MEIIKINYEWEFGENYFESTKKGLSAHVEFKNQF